jgi:ketosteroid isomerase-like protein
MEYKNTIKEYYRCFKDADKEGLRSILPPDFKHISEYAIYSNRDKMIEDIWPNVGKTYADDMQIFGDHPEYFVRYKVVGGDEPSRNMAEYIRFDGDKIAEIEVFTGRELK